MLCCSVLADIATHSMTLKLHCKDVLSCIVTNSRLAKVWSCCTRRRINGMFSKVPVSTACTQTVRSQKGNTSKHVVQVSLLMPVFADIRVLRM